MNTQACQCPDEGVLHDEMRVFYDPETELPFVKHEPGECKCTNQVAQYERKGKKLWLCSCCHRSGDRLVFV